MGIMEFDLTSKGLPIPKVYFLECKNESFKYKAFQASNNEFYPIIASDSLDEIKSSFNDKIELIDLAEIISM